MRIQRLFLVALIVAAVVGTSNMDALNEMQKHLIPQIIANPGHFAIPDTTRSNSQGVLTQTGINNLFRVVPPGQLPADAGSTGAITTISAELDVDFLGGQKMPKAAGTRN